MMDEQTDSVEYVTLILKTERFEVKKEEFAKKSRYFESLFSANFNDFLKKEHVINYDIGLSTLKDFIEWVQDHSLADVLCSCLKQSMKKFANDNFVELLNLLELSVLFAADELTCDIVDAIVLYWLTPEKVIDIWLLAEELNIKILGDICLSICLDRFIALPIESVVRLPEEQFRQLIYNVNRNSSTDDANDVRINWSNYNNATLDVVYPPKKQKNQILYGTCIYQPTCNPGIKKKYVEIWNNNSEKSIELPESLNHFVGMEFVAKDFSIYLIGGESHYGTGKFNKTILRYCLLSKKWYYYATMPSPRRHMIAAFLGNNLVLVGGVGKHRLKLNSVDILNIYTGTWKQGEQIPETFIDIPPHCVVDGALFFIASMLFVYHLTDDASQSHVNKISLKFPLPHLLTLETMFLVNGCGEGEDETLVSRITVEPVDEQKNCSENNVEHRLISRCDVSSTEIQMVKASHYFVFLKHMWMTLNGQRYGMLMITPYSQDLCLHIHTKARKINEPRCTRVYLNHLLFEILLRKQSSNMYNATMRTIT